ncbi:hypothetical protein NIES4075_29230 [Tolypothrix sp. NIES-4075]|nr:hypothetical protein NIES4075_29230 [Tolypothrix sp. NIES-4075]
MMGECRGDFLDGETRGQGDKEDKGDKGDKGDKEEFSLCSPITYYPFPIRSYLIRRFSQKPLKPSSIIPTVAVGSGTFLDGGIKLPNSPAVTLNE